MSSSTVQGSAWAGSRPSAPDGQPHVVPTSFRYNPEHDAIDVGGLRMSKTKKLRDVQRTGRASIVIDDVLPPWQPRMTEVRGTAAVIPPGQGLRGVI